HSALRCRMNPQAGVPLPSDLKDPVNAIPLATGSEADGVDSIRIGHVAAEFLRAETIDDGRSLWLISDLSEVARTEELETTAAGSLPCQRAVALHRPVIDSVPSPPADGQTT